MFIFRTDFFFTIAHSTINEKTSDILRTRCLKCRNLQNKKSEKYIVLNSGKNCVTRENAIYC